MNSLPRLQPQPRPTTDVSAQVARRRLASALAADRAACRPTQAAPEADRQLLRQLLTERDIPSGGRT